MNGGYKCNHCLMLQDKKKQNVFRTLQYSHVQQSKAHAYKSVTF